MSVAKTFASLVRKTQFITQGDFRNSTIVGKIFHIVNDDLYVDVGLKFHAVVRRPRDSNKYFRGSLVKVKLIDYELTDRFIGTDRDMTLLEADAILLGLYDEKPVASGSAS